MLEPTSKPLGSGGSDKRDGKEGAPTGFYGNAKRGGFFGVQKWVLPEFGSRGGVGVVGPPLRILEN